MLTRMLLLTAVIGSGLVFLSGAWPGPFTPPSQVPPSRLVSQSFPLDPRIIGSGVGATDLLNQAVEKLDWRRATWLRTQIRQTMSDPEARFTAAGFLQRGPNHCAHLEMTVDTNGSKARVLVVSDGVMVASVHEVAQAKPVVSVRPFPITDDANARHGFLRTMNCDGPAASLKDIAIHLRNGKLQTGRLGERRVIQIAGELDAATSHAKASLAIRHCQVHLDAATLWPCQIEWFGVDAHNRMKPILRVEYGDPEINQELSLSECARLFSYQP